MLFLFHFKHNCNRTYLFEETGDASQSDKITKAAPISTCVFVVISNGAVNNQAAFYGFIDIFVCTKEQNYDNK